MIGATFAPVIGSSDLASRTVPRAMIPRRRLTTMRRSLSAAFTMYDRQTSPNPPKNCFAFTHTVISQDKGASIVNKPSADFTVRQFSSCERSRRFGEWIQYWYENSVTGLLVALSRITTVTG